MALTKEELSERERSLNRLIEMMRPAVQGDGGDLELIDVDYEKGVVTVKLSGACGSCALAGTTVQEGVEKVLKSRLPWVSEVIGEVDESLDPEESRAMGRGFYVPRL